MKESVLKVVELAKEEGVTARAISGILQVSIGKVRDILATLRKNGNVVYFKHFWFSSSINNIFFQREICWCGQELVSQTVLMLNHNYETDVELVCPIHGPTVDCTGVFDINDDFQISSIDSMRDNCIRPTVLPMVKVYH